MSLLNDSFYVDDFLGGAQNEDDASNVYERAQTLMKEGGFAQRKWTSNSKTFRERYASREKKEDSLLLKKSDELTNCKSDETIYVLKIDQTPKNPGLNLTDALEDNNVNVESDKFHFDPTRLMECSASLPPTKRSVLKVSAKIFDPVGILTPLTINLKCLFQILCTDHVDWDTELD